MMRAAALAAVTAAVAAATTGPLYAAAPEPPLVNEELVVADVDASGLPTAATLYSRLSARNYPAGEVRDPSSTTNVEYVDRRGAPPTSGSDVLIDMGGEGRTSVTTRATFDKPLPVALHAEYRQGPRVLDPEVVDEAAGQMRVTYTVTNTTAKRTTIRYRDASGRWTVDKQPVFAPFVGALVATLPKGTTLLQAPSAVRGTTPDGRTQLTWNLVLYPPIGDFQQDASMVVEADPLGIPGLRLQVVPVSSKQSPQLGFSTELLRASVDGNAELADGMVELDRAAVDLATGADGLSEGLRQLGDGTTALTEQVNGALVPGSSELADGAGQLAQGQQEAAKGTQALAEGQQSAAEGAASAVEGASALADGAEQLSDGLLGLYDGVQAFLEPDALPDARDGADDLAQAVLQLRDVIGSGSDPDGPFPPNRASTLVQAVRAATKVAGVSQAGSGRVAGTLEDVAAELGALAATAGEAAVAAGSARAQADLVYQQACVAAAVLTPAQCTALQQAVSDAQRAQSAAADVGLGTGKQAVRVGAQAVAVQLIAESLKGIAAALVTLDEALTRISLSLVSGNPDSPGVYEGLIALTDGLTSTVQGLAKLSNGAAESASGAQEFRDGTQDLTDGLADLADGATELADGADDLARGSADLAEGGRTLADGSRQQARGTAAVGQALTDVDAGVGAAEQGAEQLADGADQLQRDGTSEVLAGIVKASRDPAFARAYLKATQGRAADALPYGPPKGASGRVAYVYALQGSDEAPPGPVRNAGWALLAVVLAAGAALAWRRLHPVGAGGTAAAAEPVDAAEPADAAEPTGGGDGPSPFAPEKPTEADWFFRP